MPPVDISVFNTSSKSLRVHWSNVPPDHRNGLVRAFTVRYRKVVFPADNYTYITTNINDACGSNVSIPDGDNRSCLLHRLPNDGYMLDIIGLEIYTVYDVSLQAITIRGGNFSSLFQAQTDEDGKHNNVFFSRPVGISQYRVRFLRI